MSDDTQTCDGSTYTCLTVARIAKLAKSSRFLRGTPPPPASCSTPRTHIRALGVLRRDAVPEVDREFDVAKPLPSPARASRHCAIAVIENARAHIHATSRHSRSNVSARTVRASGSSDDGLRDPVSALRRESECILQPIIAPKNFTVDGERWRAENAQAARLVGRLFHQTLRFTALGAGDNGCHWLVE